jgi:hypothetical protein
MGNKKHTQNSSENLMGRDQVEDIDRDGKIILRWKR